MEYVKVLFFPKWFRLPLVIVSVFWLSFFAVFPVFGQDVIIGDSAEISVTNIQYEVSDIPGDAAEVLITVQNIGNISGTYSMNVFLDEISIGNISGELVGQSIRTHKLYPGKIQIGSHVIRCGEFFESFIIPNGGVEFTDLKLSPKFISQSDTVTLSGLVINTSVFGQSYSFPVFVDGIQVDVVSGQLLIGEEKGFRIDVTRNDVGFHSVTLGSEYSGIYGILPPIVSEQFSFSGEFVDATVKAIDFNGHPVEVSGSKLEINYLNDEFNIEFPVNLHDGQKLASFNEPKGGIYYQDNQIRLRLTRERQTPEVWIVADENVNLSIFGKSHVFFNTYLLITHGLVPLSTDDLMPDLIYVDVKAPTKRVKKSANIKLLSRISMEPHFNELLKKYAPPEDIVVRSAILGLQLELDEVDDSGLRDMDVGVSIDQDWMSTLGGSGNFRYAWENPFSDKIEFAPVTLQSINDEAIRISGTVPSVLDTLWLLNVNQGVRDSLEIISVIAEPKLLLVDDDGFVRISMKNTGENIYNGILPIKYDGIPFQAIPVKLQPNQSLELIVHFIGEEGNHFISVGGQVAEIQIRKRVPETSFIVENLQIFEDENETVENTYILINIRNNSEISAIASKKMKINGEPVKDLRAIIEPGETHEFKEKFINKTPGKYIIAVDNQTINWEVKEISLPPIFSIENIEVPLVANPGESIEVKYRLNNTGGTGIFNGTLIIGTVSHLLQSVPITSYSSIPVIDEVIITESGELTVQLMDQQTILKVANAAEIDMVISDLKITPLSGKINNPLAISVMIYNQHAFLGTDSVVLKVNGKVIDQQRVWVGPRTKKTIKFEYIPEISGWDQVDINGVSKTVEIVSNIPRYIILFGIVGFILFVVSTYFSLYSYKSKRISSG